MAESPSTLSRLTSRAFSLAKMELSVLRQLHADVQATVSRMTAADPGLAELLRQAYGYAVFPSVGKATAVIGGAFGKGEVFQEGELIGYAAVVQLTIGVQVGGQTFSEIIAFENKQAMERFKAGRYAFAANASAVLVKAGAAASVNYEKGAAVLVHSDGGMMLEAAIGGQKFFFRPAVLGRGKTSKKSTSAGKKRQTSEGPARGRTKKRAGGKSAGGSGQSAAGRITKGRSAAGGKQKRTASGDTKKNN